MELPKFLKKRKRNGKNVLEFVMKNKPKQRTKSDTVPNKFVGVDLQVRGNEEKSRNWYKTKLELLAQNCEQVAYIFATQFATGCRISEILSIEAKDILEDGRIIIQRAKRGEITALHPGDAIEYLIKCRLINMNPWDWLSYNFVWRAYKKAGIGEVVGKRQRQSVTHIIRHKIAAMIRNEGKNENAITGALGHKSKNTKEHYGK
ncbi:MAG: phage integrase family protein [Saprospiraceae bacterium]|nr:phage integrase family protein [Saprospiraceae bacterium]